MPMPSFLRVGIYSLCLTFGMLFAISIAVSTASAKQMQAAGSRVLIDVPEAFTPARRFLGFQHSSGASILILEVPGHAFPQMRTALTAKMLATRGIVDVKPIVLPDGDPRVALTGRQATQRGWFEKVMLLIGDPQTTALVTVNIPAAAIEAGRISRDAMVTAVKTVSFAPNTTPRQKRFHLTDHAPLKFAGAFAGDALVYNKTGTLPRERLTRATTTFVVAGSIDARTNTTPDREATAMRLLQSLRDIRRLTVSQTEAIRIDGLRGVAHTARADYTVAGRAAQPIAIYQVVLFETDGGYIRMLGQAPLSNGRAAIADFKRMAASLKRRRR